jgi:hypothetical protein
MGVVVNSIIPDIIEGKSKVHGRGAISGRHYNSGDVIADWTPTFLASRAELPAGECVAVQVGPDHYVLGVADGATRLMNHSCDPGAAVIIGNGKVILKAIRPINPMMEITFDYSITMQDDSFSMTCNCGAKNCRGVVREFRALPQAVRERYEWMKVVPAYVLVGVTPANARAG